MPEKLKELSRPTGISRLLYRLPILLYKIGLGWILGKRFLLLTHTGRISGEQRHSVIEVVRYDEESHSYFVASGWGTRSDWYKNLNANPNVTIQSGREKMPAVARRLDAKQAGNELLAYKNKHPALWKELVEFIGYSVDGTDEDIFALGELIPVFAFEPRT
jgi:deazaflavin-dependent oxidoreductase (nitroreductase family)